MYQTLQPEEYGCEGEVQRQLRAGQTNAERSALPDCLLNGGHSSVHLLQFRGTEPAQTQGEKLYPAPAPQFENFGAFFRGFDQQGAPVLLVGVAARQVLGFQGVNDSAHGGRTHLLGERQFIERERAAKHEDGKGRELRRPDAGRDVLTANQTKKVDSGRVQAVGKLFGRSPGSHRLARLIISLTKVKTPEFN